MADETTDFILGDAAVDALGQPRKRRLFGRRKPRNEQPLTHCENCGTALTGNYCAECGQHAIDYRRSLVRVLIDAADSFFNWDTKFLKSVGILLIKPWKLTNDFNAGKRVRYVHPLRLYLLASIAFFLIARLLNFNGADAIQFDVNDRAEFANALGKLAAPESGLDEAERAKVAETLAKLPPADVKLSGKDQARMQAALGTLIASSLKQKWKEKDHAKLNKALDRLSAIEPAATPEPAAEPGTTPPAAETPEVSSAVEPTPIPSPTAKEHSGIHFSDTPDENKNPFERWMETRIKDKIGEGGTKGKLFLETLRSNIPTMMLCCVPLFAFVLKLLYIRQRRFYVEHLVYALHIHTFAYVGVVVIVLLSMAAQHSLPALRGLIIGLLCLALFVQVFLSIRRVYRQGWFFTTFKFLLGGLAYFVILVTAVALTAFVTLLLPG